jgi:hypothetical protein
LPVSRSSGGEKSKLICHDKSSFGLKFFKSKLIYLLDRN